MKNLLGTLALIAGAFIPASASTAGLIVTEDFNYGSATSLTGQNGGTGFSAAWNGGSYTQTGLSFSNLNSTGGAYSGVTGGQRVFSSAFPSAGPIYGSFLFDFLATPAGVQQVGIGNSGATNNQNSAMRFEPISDAVASKPSVGVQGAPESALTATALSKSTPYLYLFHYSASSATSWVLTAGQYANFRSGGMSELALNSASIGSSSTNVTGRASVTGSVSQALTQLNLYSFQASSTLIDRIYLSNASLLETVGPPIATPEPSTLALAASGLVALGFRWARSRRTR